MDYQQAMDSRISTPKTTRTGGFSLAEEGDHNLRRVWALNSLCVDLVAIKARCNDNIQYVRHVMATLFDNVDVDLCSIYPKADRQTEDLTQKVSCLIGYDSPNFKTIITSDQLIEEFIELFTRHAEASKASFQQAQSSLYVWLLKSYVYHLLPAREDAFSFLRSANWFKKTSLVKRKDQRFSTPFRLLKDEVYGELSRSLNESNTDDVSVFSKFFLFIELLFVNLASLSVTPTPTQLVSLSLLSDFYLDFLLSDYGDKDLQSFRYQLRSNRQFAHVLVPFLRRNLASFPIDSSFVLCFELLINFLYPGSTIFHNEDEDLLKLFIGVSTSHFVDVLYVVVDRIANSNMEMLLEMGVLKQFTELFNSDFIRILCSVQTNASDFLEPVEAKLHDFLVRNQSVPQTQNDSISFRLQSLITSIVPTEVQALNGRVRKFLAKITETLRDPYCVYPPDGARKERQLVAEVIDLTQDVYQTSNLNNTSLNGSLDQISFRRVGLKTPDFTTDPWTQMYHLTPRGIDQVLQREACFNFSAYKDQLSKHTTSKWQCHWLADQLHDLAISLSRHPAVMYLKHNAENEFVGPVIKLALQPASPIRGVPVYGKDIPRRPETINLKWLSYYPVIFFVILLFYNILRFIFSTIGL